MKLIKLINIKYSGVIFKISCSTYKFIVVYILYGVCMQTYAPILCDLKRSPPGGECEVCHVGRCVILNILIIPIMATQYID
jgi:hypothetical protein